MSRSGWPYDRDAIVPDYFLDAVGKIPDAGIPDTVEAIVSSDALDPAVLRRIDWELPPVH